MISKIVHKLEPVTLVGAADIEENALKRVKHHAPTLIGADGGAAHIVNSGQIPAAVIGDMDSLSGELKAQLPQEALHQIDEQDNTDFEKCLLRIEAPVIVGLGFLGGRLDHQLAVFSGLMRFAHQRCLLLGRDEVVFLCPPEIELPFEAGTPVSLFPMAKVTGMLKGLEWSFDALDLEPGGRLGTSNVASGVVHLKMNAPATLCICPASCFEGVFNALAEQPGSWPARA